jgi:subtilisin family serine protease
MTYIACSGHVVPRMRTYAYGAMTLLLILITLTFHVADQTGASAASAHKQNSDAQVQAEYLTRTNSVDFQGKSLVSTFDGTGTVIGIFDGGVNLDHEALKEGGHTRIVSQTCIGDSAEINPCSSDPQRAVQNYCETLDIGCFHGMSVAGFAAGERISVNLRGEQNGVGGIAPNAEVSYVREAMNKTGTIKYESFVSALNFFLSEVRTGSASAPDVINLSLSFPRDSYQNCEEDNEIKRAIDELVTRGVVVVAATGNDSNKSQVSYPACMNNVFAVGSSTLSRGEETISDFSNTSTEVDLVAPGDDVLSYLPQEERYARVSGTSFATPLISGAVALIKQAKPGLSPSDIESILVSTGDPVVDPATGQTFPRLNIGNALAAVAPTPAKVVVEDQTTPANVAVEDTLAPVSQTSFQGTLTAGAGQLPPLKGESNLIASPALILGLSITGIFFVAGAFVIIIRRRTSHNVGVAPLNMYKNDTAVHYF